MRDLAAFLQKTKDVPGFFTKEAMICWDFFLDIQQRYPINGHFLEIGVFEGKSAALGAMYVRPEEQVVLVDINPCEDGLRRVRAEKPDHIVFLQQASHDARHAEPVRKLAGSFRFIHIDGDHSGYSVTTDLKLAADALCEQGVICMDDFFNPIYPQVTAAVYRFLFDNPLSFRMVLCGGNKCFLVKASAYRIYEELIRKFFLDHAAQFDARLSLHKSTYAHDYGCFSLWTENDRRAFGIGFDPERDRRLVGIDANNAEIVF